MPAKYDVNAPVTDAASTRGFISPSGTNGDRPVASTRGITFVESDVQLSAELFISSTTVRALFLSASITIGDAHGIVTCGSSDVIGESAKPLPRTSTKYG